MYKTVRKTNVQIDSRFDAVVTMGYVSHTYSLTLLPNTHCVDLGNKIVNSHSGDCALLSLRTESDLYCSMDDSSLAFQ